MVRVSSFIICTHYQELSASNSEGNNVMYMGEQDGADTSKLKINLNYAHNNLCCGLKFVLYLNLQLSMAFNATHIYTQCPAEIRHNFTW